MSRDWYRTSTRVVCHQLRAAPLYSIACADGVSARERAPATKGVATGRAARLYGNEVRVLVKPRTVSRDAQRVQYDLRRRPQTSEAHGESDAAAGTHNEKRGLDGGGGHLLPLRDAAKQNAWLAAGRDATGRQYALVNCVADAPLRRKLRLRIRTQLLVDKHAVREDEPVHTRAQRRWRNAAASNAAPAEDDPN